VLDALPLHEDVKDPRVQGYDETQQEQVLEESPQIPADPTLLEESGHLRGYELHLDLPGESIACDSGERFTPQVL